jgi:hypothetical protein
MSGGGAPGVGKGAWFQCAWGYFFGLRFVCFGIAEFFVGACAGRFVSRLTREFLLAVAPKETKKSCPNLGSPLRCDFPRSVVAPGAGETGHPWPFTPLAAPGRSTPYATTPLGLRPWGGQITSQIKIKSRTASS